MTQYDETNRFVLFFNNEKKSERGPDWSGKLDVDGKTYFIDGWIKQGRSGSEFISGSIKPMDSQRQQAPRQQAPSRRSDAPPRTHADRPGGPRQVQREYGQDPRDDWGVPF